MDNQGSRRDFILTAAGAAALTGSSRIASAADARKTRSYNENMEYRRLGRTGC